ncbi:NAD-P-binding protein [Mycena rebaudengoi]|nr:NAD-P-binding protein [Mycena rebaudengoi]
MLTATFLLLLAACLSTASSNIESKQELFLSAPLFAVVGASNNETKFGTISISRASRAYPHTPHQFSAASQGIPCLPSLADLPDPSHTSVSIVTPALGNSVTLEILKQAAALGIFAVWLQPGAEDAAVRAFIANSTALSGRSIFSTYTIVPCSLANDLISILGG